MMDTNAAVLAGLILRAKAQIIADALDGQLGDSPGAIVAFSSLHSHTDANCYGGVCEEHVVHFLTSLVRAPGAQPDDGPAQWEEACNQFVSPMQTAVDRWLADSGIRRVLQDLHAGNVDRAAVRAMALGIPADTGAEFVEAFL